MDKKYVTLWLLIAAFMVITMVFIGGWTRLADAGLSITEWKPVTGIFPPMNNSDWEIEFTKYKNSPEYQKLHNHFTIDDFKEIFWLEFMHRILGRLTGAIILIPALIFWYKGYLRDWKPYFTMVMLVGLQGAMGWWMVKSGLVDNPYVSHFRLAAHLLTALLLYSFIIWEIFILSNLKTHSYSRLPFFILILLFCQCFLGALVAGLDAGMIYNTFPMMGNNFIPPEFNYSEFNWSLVVFSDPASVQFLHRIVAYLVGLFIVIMAYKFRSESFISYSLLVVILAQITLGILTVLYVVPLPLALAHQLFAVLLLTLVLYMTFITRR